MNMDLKFAFQTDCLVYYFAHVLGITFYSIFGLKLALQFLYKQLTEVRFNHIKSL